MAEPSCLEELPSSLRDELVSLGAWIRDGLLQGEAVLCFRDYLLELFYSEQE